MTPHNSKEANIYAEKQIVCAKKFLEEGDSHMANYCLRDLPQLKILGLDDLSWAYHNGTAACSEIEDLIQQLEKYIGGNNGR